MIKSNKSVFIFLIFGILFSFKCFYVQNAFAQRCCQSTNVNKHLIIMLDLSGSMNQAEYIRNKGRQIPVNTLDLLSPIKDIIGYVIQHHLNLDDAFTIIPFGDSASTPFSFEIQKPSTKDAIISAIQNLSAQYDYTDLGLVLEKTLNYIDHSVVTSKRDILIFLISDGLHDPSPNISNRYKNVKDARFSNLLNQFNDRIKKNKWIMEIIGISEFTDLSYIADKLQIPFTPIEGKPDSVKSTLSKRMDNYFGCFMLFNYFPSENSELKIINGGITSFPLFSIYSKNMGNSFLTIENLELIFDNPDGKGSSTIASWDNKLEIKAFTTFFSIQDIITPHISARISENATFKIRFNPQDRVCPNSLEYKFKVKYIDANNKEEKIVVNPDKTCFQTDKDRNLDILLSFNSMYQKTCNFNLLPNDISLFVDSPSGKIKLKASNEMDIKRWLDNKSIIYNISLNKDIIEKREQEIINQFQQLPSLYNQESLKLTFKMPKELNEDLYQAQIKINSANNLKLFPNPIPIKIAIGKVCSVDEKTVGWNDNEKDKIIKPINNKLYFNTVFNNSGLNDINLPLDKAVLFVKYKNERNKFAPSNFDDLKKQILLKSGETKSIKFEFPTSIIKERLFPNISDLLLKFYHLKLEANLELEVSKKEAASFKEKPILPYFIKPFPFSIGVLAIILFSYLFILIFWMLFCKKSIIRLDSDSNPNQSKSIGLFNRGFGGRDIFSVQFAGYPTIFEGKIAQICGALFPKGIKVLKPQYFSSPYNKKGSFIKFGINFQLIVTGPASGQQFPYLSFKLVSHKFNLIQLLILWIIGSVGITIVMFITAKYLI